MIINAYSKLYCSRTEIISSAIRCNSGIRLHGDIRPYETALPRNFVISGYTNPRNCPPEISRLQFRRVREDFSAQAISVIVNAYSKLNCSSEELFDHLAGIVKKQRTGYSPQVRIHVGSPFGYLGGGVSPFGYLGGGFCGILKLYQG